MATRLSAIGELAEFRIDQRLDAATQWCAPNSPRDDMPVLALEVR
ncbi:MAG: hypothetical protein ABI743_03805 [bacterium]